MTNAFYGLDARPAPTPAPDTLPASPQEHQRPAPTSTTARQSPRRASRPASLPSRKPSPVCRRAEESRRPCCRLPVQVEPRRWRGREGRERGREGAAPAHSSTSQPAHTEPRPPAYTASPQRPPPPARLYRSRQAPALPRLPCLLPSLKFCFWRENRTPPPKPPNLHGNRGPATCQRPPAMIGGGHLTFSTFCHIYDMTPVPSSTHLLSNPNSARFTVRSYHRTNSWIRSGRTPHILHHFITNTPVFHNLTPVIPR